MFLAMLAKLERNDLLKADSEIKNLRLIMAQFIVVSDEFQDLFENDDLAEAVIAYADRHKLDIYGFGAEGIINGLDKVELPAYDARNEDPWDWEEGLNCYDRKFGPLGGDSYDITTWTSAKHKEHNWDDKDPLEEDKIDALKKGLLFYFS